MTDLFRASTRDARGLVLIGIILAYVWRFHVLVPTLEIFRLSALLTLSAWGFLLLSPGGRTLTRGVGRPFVWLYIGLLLWAFLGHPFGLYPENSYNALKDVHLRNLLFLLFVLGSINSFRRLEMALAATLLGATVLVFFYIKGGTPTQWTPVPTYDRNDLALLFNMSLPIVLWFVLEQRTRFLKVGMGLVAAALVFSVVMSQSRGGFLGLGVIGIYLLFSQKTVRLRYRVTPIVILVAGFFALPDEVTDRLNTLRSLDDDYNMESSTGRVEIWKRGLGYLGDRPAFGVGLRNFAVAEAVLSTESRQFAGRWKASVAHNTYLEIMVEAGYPGGLLYLGIVGSLLVSLRRARRRLGPFKRTGKGRSLHRLATFLTASVLGFAFGSFFLSTFLLSLLVMTLGLVGGFLMVADSFLVSSKVPRRAQRRPRTSRRVETARKPALLLR